MYPPCLTQIYVRDSFFSAHLAFAILFPLSSIYLLTYTAGIISLPQAFDCFKFPTSHKNVATLITLLRAPIESRIGSTKLELPKWHKYCTLNRVIRVSMLT